MANSPSFTGLIFLKFFDNGFICCTIL
ncbi:hypothetical protein CAEBREN_30541, partial [Caenorhabditis brenneri]